MAARRADPAGALKRIPARSASSGLPDRDPEGRVVLVRSQDGLQLAARNFEAPLSDRLPLLCLPGLSRNSRDFLKLGAYFSKQALELRRVVALDYRGRGLSDRDSDWRNYAPLVEAHDVLAVSAALGLERAVVVGTSRGGIIAMLLAALRPGLLAGVVLNDIGPVIEGTGLARIRKYLGGKQRLLTREQSVAAAREPAQAHFPALTNDDWQAYWAAFYRETPQGYLADFDPKLMKAFGDVAVSERVPVLWPQFMGLSRVPVLAIRGEHSDILSPRTLSAMAERHPRLQQLTVYGQGHAPLLRDMPTLERIAEFARACDTDGN